MLRALGILIYIVSLLIHRFWGDNGVAIWVALYHMLQNAALSLICLGGFKEKLSLRLIAINGFCYFTSAFTFYGYALFTNQKIYFSGCGEAGEVLGWLMAAATLFTLIHAYYARRK